MTEKYQAPEGGELADLIGRLREPSISSEAAKVLCLEAADALAAQPKGEWVGIPLAERLDNLMHAAQWDKDEVPHLKANLIRDIERWQAVQPQPTPAEGDVLRKALERAREDINWMLNSRQLLNRFVFDYIDEALGEQSQPQPKVMVNGLTEAETNETASVKGLIGSDTARLDFIQANPTLTLRHHKRHWSLVGFTNYEYPVFKTVREAIDHTMNGGKDD